VKTILDEAAVQEKIKNKVANMRDRKCMEAIVKAGGDDSHQDVVKFFAQIAQRRTNGTLVRRKV